MDKGQKLCTNDTKGKMVISHQNGRSHFLNLWWILSMKDKILKFLWFRDSFEGVWDENMQEDLFLDHFRISLFLTVLTSEGYFGNYKTFVPFLEKTISGKIVANFQSYKTSSRLPKKDFVWPSKRSQQIAVQKSYFD